MASKRLTLILMSAFLLEFVEPSPSAPVKPGIDVLLSAKGLNTAVKSIINSLRGKSLPDIRRQVGYMDCTMYRMTIESLTYQDSNVRLAGRNSVSYRLSNARITIPGHLTCDGFFSHDYDFNIWLSGLYLEVVVFPELRSMGRLAVRVQSCTSRLNTGCSVSGGFFSGMVEDAINKELQKFEVPNSLCPPIQDMINKQMAGLPVRVPIEGTQILLDFRFLASPTTSRGYLRTQQKGEFFYGRDSAEAPFEPLPIMTPQSSDKMMTVCAADYVINTLGFVITKKGILNYKLSKQNVPTKAWKLLATTCEEEQECIGNAIKQLGTMFPNSYVELMVNITSIPSVHTQPGQVLGHLGASIAFNVHQPSLKIDRVFAVKLGLSVSASGKISKNNGYRLTANITNVAWDVVVIKSNIGHISASVLRKYLNLATKMYILPALRELGAKGYPLPPTVGPAVLVNPKLSLLKNTICFESDATFR